MNMFFPERIYNYMEHTENSNEWLIEIDEFMKSDSLVEYSKKSRYLFDPKTNKRALKEINRMRTALIDKPEYQREMNIFFLNYDIANADVATYEADTDVENVLMFYYFYAEYWTNYKKNTEKSNYYQKKFIKVFNENKDFDFSDRVYVKMLQYQWHYTKLDYYNRILCGENMIKVFDEFTEYVNKSYTDIKIAYPKLDNDSFNQIMKHKIIQEFYNWLKGGSNLFITYCKKSDIVIMMQHIEGCVTELNYKYEYFNYNLFMVYHHMFLNYFDIRDFGNCYRILKIIIDLINSAYSDITKTIKSLTHHNFHFENEFLRMAMFYSIMITDYIPNINASIDIDKIPDLDRPFFVKGLPIDETLPAYDKFSNTLDHYNNYYNITLETYKIFNIWINNYQSLNTK